VVLTGIPRSGTTLLTALLDCPPTSVAIGEPHGLGAFQKKYANDHSGFLEQLNIFFSDLRANISDKKSFKDRIALNGKPLTNYVEGSGRQRSRSYHIADRHIEHLNKDFSLIIKAPVIFTATLPAILNEKSYKVIAVIRNPIATILSWNSLQFPIANGRLPAGEEYWPELGSLTAANFSILQKQVKIWDLFARRYLDYKNEITILRYEDIIANPQAISQSLCIPFRSIPCENMNNNPSYDFSNVSTIMEAIHKYSPVARLFYP